MPADAVYPWLLTPVLFAAQAATGATRIRHSLRPLSFSRAVRFQQLGHFVPRDRRPVSAIMSRPILRDAAKTPLLRMRWCPGARMPDPRGEERGNAARLRTMLRIAGRTTRLRKRNDSRLTWLFESFLAV